MVIWTWPESKHAGFPCSGSDHHWCGDYFFFCDSAIFTPKIKTSTTLTMAGSVDSAAVWVTNTAEAVHKWADDDSSWLWPPVRRLGPREAQKTTHRTQHQPKCGRGYAGWEWMDYKQQSTENDGGICRKTINHGSCRGRSRGPVNTTTNQINKDRWYQISNECS